MDDAAREKALQLLGVGQVGTKIPVWLDCDTGSCAYFTSDLIIVSISTDEYGDLFCMRIRFLSSDINE